MSYAKHFSTRKTPQSEAIPGSTQVPNSAGGFAWAVDDWTRLDRFLILGNEGGSYYATEKKLTVENAGCVIRCFKENPVRTLQTITEISVQGRAPKNDPAIFALAICFGEAAKLQVTSSASFNLAEALQSVCRIGTHLFQFVEAVQNFRGWGRSLKTAVAKWYLDKDEKDLAYQLVKYQQRNGWSHKDVLRLCSPKANNSATLRWAIGAGVGEREVKRLKTVNGKKELIRTDKYVGVSGYQEIITAFEMAKTSDVNGVCKLIRDYDLPREAVPTEMLTKPEVWEALLQKMPMGALIRNLATMTRVGLLAPMSSGTATALAKIGSQKELNKARVHPVGILSALLTYKSGKSVRGSNTWTPVAQIVDALDGAFYKSFGTVVPTNKRHMLALDVSGSMGSRTVAGVPGLTPRVGSCAMAMVTAVVEPNHCFVAFTSGGWQAASRVGPSMFASGGYSNCITPLTISPRQRLDDVCRETEKLPMGGTDCALPMLYAMDQKIPVDVFSIYTDSETWHGRIHPSQALQEYRQKMGIPSKLVVVGMVSNGFTIADPNDAGMIDVVGFDTATPQVISDFSVG